MTDDPTRVRNQPALTTSTGRSWLILGGLFTVIAVIVLIPLMQFEPKWLALTAIIVNVVLYVVMIGARLGFRSGRLRLGVMAFAMIGIAVVSLAAVIVLAGAA